MVDGRKKRGGGGGKSSSCLELASNPQPSSSELRQVGGRSQGVASDGEDAEEAAGYSIYEDGPQEKDLHRTGGSVSADRWCRRLLRIAVHSRDAVRVRQLISTGVDVNTVISDVFCDTALTYAVKYGYLEMVEVIVSLPTCRTDQLDRSGHSALDEAVKAWLVGTATSSNLGTRFRIIWRLLEAGACHLSVSFLDPVIFSTLRSSPPSHGFDQMQKLVRLFCERGNIFAKSTLLSFIVSYEGTAAMAGSLIVCAALPIYYVRRSPARLTMPLENALVMLRTCAHPELLARVDSDTSCSLEYMDRNWTGYSKILRILILSGHPLQMFVLSFLRRYRANAYKWVFEYTANPRPLLHLARNAVRRQLASNVNFALSSVDAVPKSMKLYLLFGDV